MNVISFFACERLVKTEKGFVIMGYRVTDWAFPDIGGEADLLLVADLDCEPHEHPRLTWGLEYPNGKTVHYGDQEFGYVKAENLLNTLLVHAKLPYIGKYQVLLLSGSKELSRFPLHVVLDAS